jgi:hypothetical protein
MKYDAKVIGDHTDGGLRAEPDHVNRTEGGGGLYLELYVDDDWAAGWISEAEAKRLAQAITEHYAPEPEPWPNLGDSARLAFQPGDRVRDTFSDGYGVVQRVEHGGTRVWVKLDGEDRVHYWDADDLEPAPAPAPAAPVKLALWPGDTVRIIGGSLRRRGLTGRITARSGDVAYIALPGVRQAVPFALDELEHAPAFKVGDRVRVSLPAHYSAFDDLAERGDRFVTATVEDTEHAEDAEAPRIKVRGAGCVQRVHPDDLTPAESEKPELRVGARVRLKADAAELMSAEPGAEAFVLSPPFDADKWLRIRWDRSDPRVHTQCDGGYLVENFEVIG